MAVPPHEETEENCGPYVQPTTVGRLGQVVLPELGVALHMVACEFHVFPGQGQSFYNDSDRR